MGMHEGKILKWLKRVGDSVVEGEILAEVESSKVVSELMADRDGVLLKLLVAEEEEVPVRTALCLIGEADEAVEQVAETEPVAEYGMKPAGPPAGRGGSETAPTDTPSGTPPSQPAKVQITPPGQETGPATGYRPESDNRQRATRAHCAGGH